MKIFNWVQRRFHQGPLKEGPGKNMKKVESITNYADKQALLKQVALVDVLAGWKDGILTIGTLGFDPLKPFKQQNEYFILECKVGEEEEVEGEEQDLVCDEEDNVEDEEANPLILTTFEQRYEDIGSNFDGNLVKEDEIEFSDPSQTTTNLSVTGIDQRRERKTLAELFLADSDMTKRTVFCETEHHSGKKSVAPDKNGLSFAKRLMPHLGDDSRPIKNLHKLVKRMLKRKIHPEFQGKGNKTDNGNKPGSEEAHASREIRAAVNQLLCFKLSQGQLQTLNSTNQDHSILDSPKAHSSHEENHLHKITREPNQA